MFEKCNPEHPDKIADRIAGAIVDLAYSKNNNPKVAVEVLIGHGVCHIIAETSEHFTGEEIEKIVYRIAGNLKVDYSEYKQDENLAKNQESKIRCGDNGIFKGVPLTVEELQLSKIAKDVYNITKTDGKYIIDNNKLIICQSHINSDTARDIYYQCFSWYDDFNEVIINPLGDWTGGLDVDTGATNRKLGSDMGHSVTGGGLCLSGNTEYIGEDLQWHKIEDYKSGKVGQWNNGRLEFVEPLKFVHNDNDSFILFENDTKLSMELTPYHNILIKTSKGNLIKKEAHQIAQILERGIGNCGSIIHNFVYDNQQVTSKYKDENDYRLQVAFCADGSIINSNQKWSGRIRVKKQHKKERLRLLLKNKDYKECSDGEYSIFWFNPTMVNKSLYECFKNESLDILYDEIFKWDGDEKRKLFRTTNKQDADFAQFVIASKGFVATISKDDRYGNKKIINGKEYCCKSICYTVHQLKSTTTGLRKNKGNKIRIIYEKNKKDSYCFEVPSHNLVVRHNNRIFATGNCGKDLSKADVSVNIYAFLKAQKTGKTVEISCAIGDEFIDGKPYEEIVEIARNYIKSVGGFEKFAEWGLI